MRAEHDRSELGELIRRFGESMRGKLASLRSAAETLAAFPRMDEDRRRRLEAVLLEESRGLSEDLEAGLKRLAGWNDARRPREVLEAAALLSELARELAGDPMPAVRAELPDGTFRVEADMPALSRGLGRLAGDLATELGVEEVVLRLRREVGFAALDLQWHHAGADLDELMSWQAQALSALADERGPSLPELGRRHGGEVWFNVQRDADLAYLRLMLPLAGSGEEG